jgi:hypothetical protein
MIWAVGVESHPRRRTILAAAVAAVGLLAAKGAWAGQAPVDLQVIDRDTGQAIQAWRHGGRLFIAGEPGRRYGLRVTNNTGGRVLAVLSVDGVNIVSGETAGYNQRGYVLTPCGSANVYGWRKSTTEIAAFSFAPLPESYAARTGRPGDVGVIGMAIFEERLPPPPPPPPPPVVSRATEPSARSRFTPDVATIPPLPVPPVEHRIEQPRPPPAPGAPAVAASPPSEKLGTAHGESERSFVTLVNFERATAQPRMTLQIEYDTYANLVAAGVVPVPPRPRDRPQPLPTERNRFVPDPPRGF